LKDPFAKPTPEESDTFVEWMAGWINYGCVRSDERLASIIAAKSLPLRNKIFDLPLKDTNDKGPRFNFFSGELQSACHDAFFDATIICISHSAELMRRIPQKVIEAISASLTLYNNHQCLGFGEDVQRAAWDHRDKVLLLQVSSDNGLFTNIGDGAIQFWITHEDLAAKSFDKVFMTAECS